MGKKNYMMVMMVALVTMLLMILPVSALTPVAKNIGPGSTIFIGEEGLDITSAMNGYDTIGYWASGADCKLDGSANTIQVFSRETTFSVTPSEFSAYTGTWYQVDGSQCKDVAFYVRDPSLSMSIMTDKDENVGGKTVATGTNLTFEINSNVYIDGKRGDVLTTVVSPIVEQFNVSTSSTGAVEFTPVISAGTPPFKYFWEFGDGTNSTLENPTHLYATTGAHVVVLTVTNNPTTGVSSKVTATVTTNPATYMGALTNFNVVQNPSSPDATVANFTAAINGVSGKVTFTDASTNSAPNAMVLSPGDGSLGSTSMPYEYTYSPVVGSHSVTYEAYNTSINSTHSKITATVTIGAIYNTEVGTFTKTLPSKLTIVSYTTDQSKGYAKVVVKTESGSAYSSLVTSATGMTAKPLDNIYLTTSETLWGSGTSFWATNAKDAGGNRVYQSGVYTAYAECDLNGMKENYKNGGSYYTGKTVSTVTTVTIGSDSLKITASKDSVVRGKEFSLTIVGNSNSEYTLIMKGATSLADNEKPLLVEFQDGVTKINSTYTTVTTGSSGTRTVGFTTSGATKDQKYTFRVQSNVQKYDEATVSVVKGGLTLVAAGDQSYFLGEEIKLSGTNSESDTTYFFIVGPNLNSNGASLDGSGDSVTNDVESTFVSTDVDSSDVFTYDWSTSMADLDSGTYTIYGVSKAKDKSHVSDAAYATVSVIIKKPYVSATSKGTVAKGDKIMITGIAEGQPSSGVAVWVLGKNYATIHTQSIDTDGTFEYEIPGADTTSMSSGQYFVVVQHPMQNDKFDIVPTNYNLRTSGDVFIENLQLSGSGMTIFKIGGSGSLQGSDAAEALVQAISDPNIDDTYTKLTIFVQEPIISINTIGDKHVGDKFTIKGKTNLAVDDEILMEVYSSSFKPTQKTQSGEFSGATGTIKVTAGEAGMNEFAFDVDSSTFKTDEYLVMAQAVVQDTTGSTLFNVVEGASTPVVTPTTVVVTPAVTPVPVVTAIPTVPPTVIPTTVVPTTTAAPGFGAVFALIGLGAVGFIVVRRE